MKAISNKDTVRYVLLLLLVSSVISLDGLKPQPILILIIGEVITLLFLVFSMKRPFWIPFYIVFILIVFDMLMYLWEKAPIAINGNAPFFEMGGCALIAISLALLHGRSKKGKPLPEIIALSLLSLLTLIIYFTQPS